MAKKVKQVEQEPIELTADEELELAGLEAGLVVEEALPEPVKAAEAVVAPAGFTLLLEDGSRVAASANQARAWRAQGDDNHYYEHVRESPDGEWIYKLVV